MVPGAGIEPARLSAGDFESPASTNFTTRAGRSKETNYGTVQGMTYPTIEDAIGKTPLVALQRIQSQANTLRHNVVLGKLEGNNPAGSVKDRPALSMIKRAEERGEIQPGDTLIEATSGNTGIALAMAAAIKGYRMVLIMPEDLSIERAQTMKAFGAELILTPKSGGMEHARLHQSSPLLPPFVTPVAWSGWFIWTVGASGRGGGGIGIQWVYGAFSAGPVHTTSGPAAFGPPTIM